MTENKTGLHFTWFTAGGQTGVYYCNSSDNGQNFSPRQLLGTEARHPQTITLLDETVGIVWDEGVKKDSGYYSKIVLQVTTVNGQQTKQDVTGDNVNASFPVQVSNHPKIIVVAWVEQANKGRKGKEQKQHQHSKGGQVFYKMIHLE